MATKKKEVPAVIKGAGVVVELISAIFRAVFRLGGTEEDIHRLVTPDGEATIEKIAALIVQASKPVQAVVTACLRFVRTVAVSGHDRFVAADHFKIDTSAEAEVSIGYMNPQFQRVMLGKVEEHIPATELNISSLTRDTLSKEVRAELTPQAEVVSLAHLWDLLSMQGHGQAGALLTDGQINRLCVMDGDGSDAKLWVVSALWDGRTGDWGLHANSATTSPFVWWDAGGQVVSRKVG